MNNTLIAASTKTLNFAKEATGILPGADGGTVENSFGNWLGGLMSAVMVIAVILVLIFLLWGGIEWITSGGDKSKLEAARNKITSAIIGIIVLAASTAIFMIIQNMLGLSVIKFGNSSKITPTARDKYSIKKATSDESRLDPGL